MILSNFKKSLAFLLTVMIILSVLPLHVFAAETGDDFSSEPDIITEQAVFTPAASGAESRALTDSKLEVNSSNISGKFSYTADGSRIAVTAEHGFLSKSKGTVNIVNKTDKPVVLSFRYYATKKDSVSGGAISGTSGTYHKKLDGKASIAITLSSTAIDNAYLTIYGITAYEIVSGVCDVNVEYNAAYGTVSGAGKGVAKGGDYVTVTATPTAGSKFFAWTDANNFILSKDPSYSFMVAGTETIKAVFTNPGEKAYFEVNPGDDTYFATNNYLYTDLNKAAAAGTKVILAGDGTLSAGNYNIPSGVTLLIPKDAAYTDKTTVPDRIDKSKYQYVTPSAFRTLHMAEGAKITVKGALNVAGTQYAGGTGDVMGGVYGPVGFINMATGSKITVNNAANLYVWGYIIGSGEVEILNGGTVYESFQTMDWRGGSASVEIVEMTQSGKNDVFPISQYYVQNVEVPMKLNKGANEKGYTCTTISSIEFAGIEIGGVQGTEVPFIGSGSSSLFNINSNDGYIIKDYDEVNDRQLYKIYGNVSMNIIEISMQVTPINKVTITSSKYVLPITSNLTIEVHKGTINLTQNICLLPGAEIIIHEGTTCNVTSQKSIFVYDSEDWGGYVSHMNLKYIPLKYTPGGANLKRTQPGDARIQIDGTVNASAGFLYTTKHGAVITSTGTGKVIMKNGTASNTYQIVQGVPNDSTKVNLASIPVQVARLQNADGTTTDPAKEINPNGGTIYTYKDGKWQADCRSSCVAEGNYSCSTPGKCKFCGQEMVINHKYTSAVTTPATCVGVGELTKTCSVCNHKVTEEIPATGIHTYNETVTTPADCVTPGVMTFVCSVCEDTYTKEIPATGHTSVTDNAVPATCTENGLTAGSHCSVCNEVLEAQMTVEATGHSPVPDAAVPATCTKDGLTAGSHCSVCNEVLEAQETVKAPGHTIVKDNAVPATCTENGLTEGSHCSVCNEVLLVQIAVKAKGHTTVTDNAVPATCTENGLTEGTHCSVCNEVLKAQETVTATGHKLSWTETKEATAFTEGESTGKCQVCDYVEKKAIAKLLIIDVKTEAKEEIKLINNGYIVTLEMTSVSSMLKNITDKSEIISQDGKNAAADSIVATGMKVVLKNADGKIVDEKTIIVPGDVNCDGKVTASDARSTLRRSVGLDEFSAFQEMAAEVNRDGKITASDAREILRASVGLVDKKDFFAKVK